MTTITLSSGHRICSLGKTHVAGGFIHILPPAPHNDILHRFIAQEFTEDAIGTMREFLAAIGEYIPNLAPGLNYGFEIAPDLYLNGNGAEVSLSRQHPLDYFTNYQDDAELLYYDCMEWQEAAEEVLGALLNAIPAHA